MSLFLHVSAHMWMSFGLVGYGGGGVSGVDCGGG